MFENVLMWNFGVDWLLIDVLIFLIDFVKFIVLSCIERSFLSVFFFFSILIFFRLSFLKIKGV